MPIINFNKNKYYIPKRNNICPVRDDWKFIDVDKLYSINSFG